MNDSTKITPLKKVTLSVEAGVSETEMTLTPSPVPVDFIFGVNQRGISDFEYELAEKTIGDELFLHLDDTTLKKTFEHLSKTFLPIMGNHHDAYFKIKVVDVKQAENREVVHAMASSTSCGCDCGCGH